jgi:GWxTD domain-containing protein
MRSPSVRNLLSLLVLCLFLSPSVPSAHAQDRLPSSSAEKISRRDSDIGRQYQKWLDEDARWIITEQELADFNKLTTDQQRDKFIEAFWERRNPAPASSENTYKEEHYRRIAYVNTHYAAGVPGYKTDRGHFYIAYGAPDFIDYDARNSPSSEVWHYRTNSADVMTLHFVDTCRCGDYRLIEEKPTGQK